MARRRFSQKTNEGTNLICFLWRVKKIKQNKFVFWENLWRANLLSKVTDLYKSQNVLCRYSFVGPDQKLNLVQLQIFYASIKTEFTKWKSSFVLARKNGSGTVCESILVSPKYFGACRVTRHWSETKFIIFISSPKISG